MDVVRLNFSHRSAEQAKPLVERVRCVADKLGVSVGILGDLRGPRIRVGEMQNGVIPLKSGNKIILSPEPIVGSPERIAVSFRGLANDVAHGTVILLDDGNIELQVIALMPRGEVLCDVLRGGALKSNKGVIVKLKELVRAKDGIELGAKNYDVNSYLDGQPSVTLAVFQLPGSNALETAASNCASLRFLCHEELVKLGICCISSRAVRWHLDRRILCYGNKTVVFD